MHLIQPIEVLGTMYCQKHGNATTDPLTLGNWRTVSVFGGSGLELTFGPGTEDADNWLHVSNTGLTAEIHFGTSQLSELEIYVSLIISSETYAESDVQIFVNGVLWEAISLNFFPIGNFSEYTFTVPLDNARPCGDEIMVAISSSADCWLNVTIPSITR